MRLIDKTANANHVPAGYASTGVVFNLQRFSTHDGPGIRTVVFLKGCALSCRWCQNPEGQQHGAELLFSSELCMSCGICRQLHPQEVERKKQLTFHRRSLSQEVVAELADACPTKAIHECGDLRSVAEIEEIVCRDLPYYRRSGGGLTLSGG